MNGTRNDSCVFRNKFGVIIVFPCAALSSYLFRPHAELPTYPPFSSVNWNPFSSLRIATFSVINWKIENSLVRSMLIDRMADCMALGIASAFISHQLHATSLQWQRQNWQKMLHSNRFCECNEMRMCERGWAALIWILVDASHHFHYFDFSLSIIGIEMAGGGAVADFCIHRTDVKL